MHRLSMFLVVLLGVQGCLLFRTLDLLPVWSDEAFTLKTAALPVREIIPAVQADIHPPLYYILLRQWSKLPLPWAGIAGLRAFSGVWALLATVLLDVFRTRRWGNALARRLALALFALSPCLLLYGRMARSYAMQAALALLAIGLLERWMREPGSKMLGCAACAAVLALLYTHYVPGVAVMAAFIAIAWSTVGAARIGVFMLAVAVGYAPWILSLLSAFRRWGEAGSFSSSYVLTGNPLLEQALKVGYGAISLTIGETFFAVSLLLAPAMVVLAARGLRTLEISGRFAAWLGIAAIIGYIGVARWVSYPFIPARMLWLLPFLMAAVALGVAQIGRPMVRWGAIGIILLSYLASDTLYFERENFLNPGYTAPLPEIAGKLNSQARKDDVILVDSYNTDYQGLQTYLTGPAPVVVLDRRSGPGAGSRAREAKTVWIVRNTRDVSPGLATSATQAAACAGRARRDTMLERYAPWQAAAMRILKIQPAPEYFYQLTVCGAER